MVERLDPSTVISYQVTAGRVPIVQPRDFLFVTREEVRGEAWMAGGCSISEASYPPSPQHTRAWQFPGKGQHTYSTHP